MSLFNHEMNDQTTHINATQSGTSDHAPDWRALLANGRGFRIAGVLAVIILHAGGNYAAVTLAPAIVAEVGGGELIAALTALFNISTVLAAAATGPLAARYGMKWLWWIMTALAISGAMLSSVAGTMPWIATGRAIAGFGGGGLLALGFVALRSEITAAAYPKISAISGAFWIGAAFAGPLIGGLFADFVGWRPAFALLGAGMLIYGIGNARTVTKVETERDMEAFPILSFAAFGLGVGLISFAPHFDRSVVAVLTIAGFVALTTAIMRERSYAPRMFPRRAFRFRTMQGSAIAAKTALGASAMSILVFGPLVLTQVHGHSATFAGAFVLIETIAWSMASFAVVSIPWGRRVSIVGPFVTLAGLVGCYLFLLDGHLVGAALSIAASGFGLGMIWPYLGEQMVAGDMDGEQTKTMAMVSSVETLGFAIGGALVGLVGAFVAGGTIHDSETILAAASAAIVFSIPFTLIGCIAAIQALRRTPQY
ncbi:MFS transporter [Pelagibius litoralis]|uniref:MFS transporter n=1 Tax=Pelagibius litoralis TaxID=374515 RepID=A0A967KIA5_9PROT|nr:MFS transporter [Pelagibius litoralis]NIA72091.1 MFS transporter [Pelagibius litoralis]